MRLTRKPRTGLPPGSLQTRGTASVAVISSQMVWINPSVPWGTSGRGSLLVSSLNSTGTCHHIRYWSKSYFHVQAAQAVVSDQTSICDLGIEIGLLRDAEDPSSAWNLQAFAACLVSCMQALVCPCI